MADYLQELKRKFLVIYSKDKKMKNTIELVFEKQALSMMLAKFNPNNSIMKSKIAFKTKQIKEIMKKRNTLIKCG
ncbi:MAG: hypothetical protein BWY78_00382 [Alphaproteobacteria bacterium ADurb.Bin438]|nr:MAG: hypothetical protein BWY78_00382 [Alphaproteobacteria bacterium ADurb.Bin438]